MAMNVKWIAEQLKLSRRTQRDLADHLGWDPSAVSRLLKGQRQLQAREIPKIEAFFGVEPRQYRAPVGEPKAGEMLYETDHSPGWMRVPVYGFSGLNNADFSFQDEPVDNLLAHPAQIGHARAFAFYVANSRMEPRYEPGDIIYAVKHRSVKPNRDAIIETKSGEAFLLKIKSLSGDRVVASQTSPARDHIFSAGNIKSIHAVVGIG